LEEQVKGAKKKKGKQSQFMYADAGRIRKIVSRDESSKGAPASVFGGERDGVEN